MTQHTIVLLQKTKNPVSRTFSDYETVQLAIDSIIKLYEQRLKELNPTVRNITYDVKDLHAYIDHMGDVVLLTYVCLSVCLSN